jgi:hypothetical protein
MTVTENEFRSVIVWFESAEEMLMAVLDVIPYEAAHEKVWSPRLVTVLLEACSQLDSLLKQEVIASIGTEQKKLNIVSYFTHFGKHLSDKWVLFWGEEPLKIKPFEPWKGLADYGPQAYDGHELAWWKGHNAVKHDRLENRREGMLRYAIEAVAALFLAILYCQVTRSVVVTSGWVYFPHGINPASLLDDHINPEPKFQALVESKLFSYPVGWMNLPIKSNVTWSGYGSDRFNHWFNAQAE